MEKFRDLRPVRRPSRQECTHYASYKSTLREDFNKRCGYCNNIDSLRFRNFEIDHFVPKTPQGFIHDIAPNNYYNLVYSCSYCNRAKSNKWPTMDSSVHNDGAKGFVDPVSISYESLFCRELSGEIIAVNENDELAQYIIDELKLWLPVHNLMWKLEKINALNDKIRKLLEASDDQSAISELKSIHYELLIGFESIIRNLMLENEH